MRTTLAFALLCLLCASAAAKGGAAAGGKPRSLTSSEATARILAATAANDEEALKALALQEHPDPWMVVSEMLRQGKPDEALAFVAAGLRPATATLAAYIQSRRGKDPNTTAHDALGRVVGALRSRQPAVGLAALPSPRLPTDTIVGIELAHHEGYLRNIQSRKADAAAAYVVAAEAAASIGWHQRAGLAFTYAGRLTAGLGDRKQGFAYMERGLAAWEIVGFHLGTGAALIEMGTVLRRADENHEAISYFERALRMLRRAESIKGQAAVLQALGLLYEKVGNYPKAVTTHERSLPLWERLKRRDEWAGTLINLGNAESALGNYPRAIRLYELGIAQARAIDKQEYLANGLLNIAGVYWRIGNIPRALVYTEEALERMKSAGSPAGIASAISALGILRQDMGDLEGAKQMFTAVLAQASVLDAKHLESHALLHLGRIELIAGNSAVAIEHCQRARTLGEAIEDAGQVAQCDAVLGAALMRQGRQKEGLALLTQVERDARSLRLRSLHVSVLTSLVQAHLDRGDPKTAMFLAREARSEVEHLLGGLGADDAATVRGKFASLFEAGTVAAMRVGDTAEVLTSLESGRAGALLELLGGRSSLQWEDIPENLRRDESDAKRREAVARAAYLRTASRGDRKKSRDAARALDAAQARLREVMNQIQREAKQGAGSLFYPRPASLQALQKLLAKDEALVIYGIGREMALALVITSAGARVEDLGTADEIRTLCQAVRPSDVSIDPGKGPAQLKAKLVTPLALPASIKRVIISPQDCVCYVPFGLILDRPVVMTPSGTTHLLLKDGAHAEGKGVLALGNPEYGTVKADAQAVYTRSGKLVPLPATGPEATAVGTTVLLGKGANEVGLRKALGERERWRAVHFACHGLVDRERPSLSALALSGTSGEDGFLTALEVLRMEMPTDLAVLSACETGQGKVMGGEGLVGLTRAFIYAGASRVLCSLWKVDDEATMALMKKFYARWNPPGGKGGISAGAALREAQAHVRSHEKWKHPYYWGAWVLWGLPD